MIFEKLHNLGITHAAVDFDGTLINTRKAFSLAITQASQLLGINKSNIDRCIDGTRFEFGVSPVIAKVAVLVAARTLQLSDIDPRVEAALERIDRLYTTDVPETFPGAISVVGALNARFATVLTTHAGPDWTNHKKLKTGFMGKFSQTYCFSVRIPKSLQWPGFFADSSIPPEKWVVIGDDLQADLAIPAELGAYTIHVPNGSNKIFSPERASHLVQPSLTVAHIADLLTV